MPVEKAAQNSEHRRAQVRMAQRRFRERQNQQRAAAAATAEKERLPSSSVNATYAAAIQTRTPSDLPEISPRPVAGPNPPMSNDWTDAPQIPRFSPHAVDGTGPSTTATVAADMSFGLTCLQNQGNGLLDLQDYLDMDGVEICLSHLAQPISGEASHARQETQRDLDSTSSSARPETLCGTFGILQWREALDYAISNDIPIDPAWASLLTADDTFLSAHASSSIPIAGTEKQIHTAGDQQEDAQEDEEEDMEEAEEANAATATATIGNEKSAPESTGESTESWQYPLHIAARNGHGRIIRMLLSRKVDCNQGDSDGMTPLMHATIGGWEEVVTRLLAYGADTSKVDHQGRSVLHWAVMHRRGTLLRLLLGHCAGDQKLVDMYNAQGRTPLHTAIVMGYEEGVKILLQAGANAHAKARKKPDGPEDNAMGDEHPNPRGME